MLLLPVHAVHNNAMRDAARSRSRRYKKLAPQSRKFSMLILWQTGSVHHKILIFCCFDFSARCLSNGTTGCPDASPLLVSLPISCCSSLLCPGVIWSALWHHWRQFSFLPSVLHFFCRRPQPQPQPEDRQTPKSATIHEFSFLLGFSVRRH